MMEDARQDEMLLIDFLLGRLDDEQDRKVRARLERDEAFRRRHEAVTNALRVLALVPEIEPPADLAERTLARIASVQRTNALLAMQQTAGGGKIRSTFSLKELSAIAAMVLILLGVLIPALQTARRRSREGLCAMQLGQIGNALQTHAINHDGMLPGSKAAEGRWLRHDSSPAASNSQALFALLKERHLTSPVVFQCPAIGGPSFVLTPELDDFPHPGHISYSYQYSFDGYALCVTDPTLTCVAEQMAILADQSPFFAGGVFRRDRPEQTISDNHPDGQNMLYLDGHVNWAISSEAGVDGDHIFLAQNQNEYDGDETPANPTDSFLLPAHPAR